MTANNLHRELAPVSEAAWQEIREEATRTFTRTIAGRRFADMPEPAGPAFSALTTGHLERTTDLCDGVRTRVRESLPVLELKVPFTVRREDVDDVLRGSVDSDWDPVKAAARTMAEAEDHLVFYGAPEQRITGLVAASSNAPVALPEDIVRLPYAVASALNELRDAGVDGPYALVLSERLYTEAIETTDHGYPILEHLQRVLKEGKIVWAPALKEAVLVSERGGDMELHLGTDLSIGYDSHDAETVSLYLYETLTFRVATSEAIVSLGTHQ